MKSNFLAGHAWVPLHPISAKVSGSLYFDSLLTRSHLHGIPIVRMPAPITGLWPMLSVFLCLNQDPFLYYYFFLSEGNTLYQQGVGHLGRQERHQGMGLSGF